MQKHNVAFGLPKDKENRINCVLGNAYRTEQQRSAKELQ